MKVLFAVSNEEISESIVKKYQKEYKQIISYKNVYYFNAILKELQKDKNYDRIVISEDLEAFTHTQYDQIDKFIFEKLDSISDEASNAKGGDIPIILICSDRRTKSEEMLVKIFGIGIYNAIIGTDRSVDQVCQLINRPRLKKEAKAYYQIESENVNYQSESENDVSEMEIQNILAHYKRIGKDDEKYVESFDNIASQYNDVQLRIIAKFLPLEVRAVLEEKSEKYQQVISFHKQVSSAIKLQKGNKNGTSEKLLTSIKKTPIKPETVVIPSDVDMESKTKLSTRPSPQVPMEPIIEEEPEEEIEVKTPQSNVVQSFPGFDDEFEDVKDLKEEIEEIPKVRPTPVSTTSRAEEVAEQPVKRGRGRPPKATRPEDEVEQKPKRGRGRPPKNPRPEDEVEQKPKRGRGRPPKNSPLEEDTLLPGLDDIDKDETYENYTLPGFDDIDNDETYESNILPGLDEIDKDEDDVLPGLDNIDNDDMLPGLNNINKNETSYSNNVLPGFENANNQKVEGSNLVNSMREDNRVNASRTNVTSNPPNVSSFDDKEVETIDLSYLLRSDKKIVTFVGTSKNGTSFIVNNLADFLSTSGVNVAILDTTRNKNSYYIYTNNEEELRNIAVNSISDLAHGTANGITVNKNLTVYTSLPGEDDEIVNVDKILETLLQNHTLILIDTDFETPSRYFEQSQETYLVQTWDILTIQPLTAFLRNLKARGILDQNKLRIILNKTVKIRGISEKTIIGGMAYYNDPAMSYMTELFDRAMIRYITIPFEEETYAKYLEGVIECNITIKGYSKLFMQKFRELSNMVFPMSNTYAPPSMGARAGQNAFTPNMNNTLNQMRNNY